jgi:hypothetical protein
MSEPITPQGRYVSKANRRVVVDVVNEAEYRIGEAKFDVVVYRRDGRLFVRRKGEFYDKFTKD